jgi:hypothetical protein
MEKTKEQQYTQALEYRLISNNDFKDKTKEKKWVTRNKKYFGINE